MLRGIDVSHHNGRINFTALANDDIQFIIAKATEGRSFVDSEFARNMCLCRQHSILHGAYHYVRGDVPAREQAQHFIDIVKVEGDSCTVLALDVEDSTLTRLPYKEVSEIVYEMVAEIHDECMTFPLIYTSEKFMHREMYNYCGISDLCGGWIAKWGSKKPQRKDLNTTIWQYSDKGRVAGIKGNVDMNYAYVSPENWLRIANPEGDR